MLTWGYQQGTRLASTRRIPGLKCETPRRAGAGWGTLRFLPKRYWEFRRELQIPPLRCASVPRHPGAGGMTNRRGWSQGENSCRRTPFHSDSHRFAPAIRPPVHSPVRSCGRVWRCLGLRVLAFLGSSITRSGRGWPTRSRALALTALTTENFSGLRFLLAIKRSSSRPAVMESLCKYGILL